MGYVCLFYSGMLINVLFLAVSECSTKKLKLTLVLLHYDTFLADVSKCSNYLPLITCVLTQKNGVDTCSTIFMLGSMCSTMNVLHILDKTTFVLPRF